MKVAIYCRVSTDDKGQDPKVQLEKCRNYCELQSHQIIAELLDEGVSGDTWFYEREKGKLLQELIEKNKIDGIVVFAIDRFSRQNPMKILPMLNNLKLRGINFISITENVFNMESEFAEPMRYMLAWFSSYFLVQHKKKVNAGIDNARKFGTKSGRPIGRQRIVNYKEILELHSKGLTLSQIARQMDCNKSSVKNALDSSKLSTYEQVQN